MIIVSDTTPIRYLVEIDQAFILEKLFGRVIVPSKVADELQHLKTPERVKAWIRNRPAWLEVREANLSLYAPQRRINDGEREAFALAIELKADAVLLDDKDASAEAARLGLTVIPTFTVIEVAAERRLIDLVATLAAMRETSFRLPPQQLLDEMLERHRRKRLSS